MSQSIHWKNCWQTQILWFLRNGGRQSGTMASERRRKSSAIDKSWLIAASLLCLDFALFVLQKGGGFVNHNFFWKIMSPEGGAGPSESGPLFRQILLQYSSLQHFKEAFNQVCSLTSFATSHTLKWLCFSKELLNLGFCLWWRVASCVTIWKWVGLGVLRHCFWLAGGHLHTKPGPSGSGHWQPEPSYSRVGCLGGLILLLFLFFLSLSCGPRFVL